MIYIVDYGAGNLRSVQKAVEYNGNDAQFTSNPDDIDKADKIIFPGVGAFGKAIEKIDALELRTPLIRFIETGKPFLGICLGLQLLFENSEENPGIPGLAVLKGSVKRFSGDLKVPHLGWNVLIRKSNSTLWEGIPANSYFYFAHSYYISPVETDIIIGESDYGSHFPVAVQKNNLYGLQFHPEKSQKFGLQVLKNFLNI
ncbi:imidazole glycerol phosphate synthase subunit HisH [candidate division KSB1 bacterium]|nr:imidazole glycerol phosphate synthase subunit HisH [candidate division KSB1 bacterium]